MGSRDSSAISSRALTATSAQPGSSSASRNRIAARADFCADARIVGGQGMGDGRDQRANITNARRLGMRARLIAATYRPLSVSGTSAPTAFRSQRSTLSSSYMAPQDMPIGTASRKDRLAMAQGWHEDRRAEALQQKREGERGRQSVDDERAGDRDAERMEGQDPD